MPSSLGPAEILVILVVALIVLGPKRLPEAGRQVGKALSEIRRWTQDMKTEVSSAFDPEPTGASAPPTAPPESVQPVAIPAPEPAPAQPVEARVEAREEVPGPDETRPDVPPAS
jgi:sec-independent protein translocase protein TatA